MADKINQFPRGAFSLPAGIKTQLRNPTTASGTGYFVTDALSIDFRVQGILENDQSPVLSKEGIKYIIGDAGSIPADIRNNYTDDSTGSGFAVLGAGDVVVYNEEREAGDKWELWFDASNDGISGASGGPFVFVVEKQNFYGYFGSDVGWDLVGRGITGNTGNTGADAVFGRSYTQQSGAGNVDIAGELFIENTPGFGHGGSERRVRIHRYAGGLEGYAGTTGDLFSVLYPSGVPETDAKDGTHPNVILSLHNATKKKTYAVRISANFAAIAGDEIEFFEENEGNNLNSFELLTSESGTGTFDPTWDENDEIYLLAIADGSDGESGVTGATGQGITFGGNVGGELNIKYIFSDGSFSDLIPTGIVDGSDGVTGDPGEIGFALGTIGATSGSLYWGNNNSGVTATIDVTTSNEIYFTGTADASAPDGTLNHIILPYVGRDESPGSFIPYAFGLTLGEAKIGTDYLNKPGTLYFYRKEGYSLNLKSFVAYDEVRCTGFRDQRVILRGIGDNLTDREPGTAVDPTRLGITTGTEIFVLPVPRGIKGVGITFGAVVDNQLFLDFIDENGNTFGRFATIEGITGPQGSMNPFNIPYVCIAPEFSSVSSTNIGVTGNNAGTGVPEFLEVSGTADSGDNVYKYLKHPIETISKTGFLTVFSETDVTNFGVFRFKGGDAFDASQNKVRYNIESHVAGNITQIIGDGSDNTPQSGFTTGNRILFALNVDGPKGFSGNTGIGFTYGNEYFISKSTERPTERTNGDILEPGDKWFCTDVGLEFTFLGAEANFVLGEPRVVGTGGNDGIVWVQTNNARQGKQGNKGDKGDEGTPGVVGATGINSRASIWSLGSVYEARDAVMVKYSDAYGSLNDINDPTGTKRVNLVANWGALGDGITNAYFVVRDPIESGGSSTTQIPGDHNHLGPGWDGFGASDWTPVVANHAIPGPDGPAGVTGDKIKRAQLTPVSDDIFLDLIFSDFDGGNESSAVRVNDASGDPVSLRGPAGEQPNIDGSDDEFTYIKSSGTELQGSDAITKTNAGSSEVVVLNNYKEKSSTTVSFDSSTNTLTLNAREAPVLVWTVSSNVTVEKVNITNLVTSGNAGDGLTLYVNKGTFAVNWNVPESGYEISGFPANEVYVSSQGIPNEGRIEFPSGDGLGAFTFKLIDIDGSNGNLAINFVPFVPPTIA